MIEAFRRLSNTAIGLVAHGKAPPSPEQIRKEQGSSAPQSRLEAAVTQDKAGLSDRDYIPLMIAIFVDICILLVSVNRPFGPFFNLGQGLSRARQRGPMQGVLETFYSVFQDQFHLQRGEAPAPGELIAPLQDVVFDYKGDYYAAVPLDFREENYDQWAKARTNEPNLSLPRALERSRYLHGLRGAEAVEDLALVEAVHIDAGIRAFGEHEFDIQLHVAELLIGDQVHGGAARAVEHAVARGSARREALGTEQAVVKDGCGGEPLVLLIRVPAMPAREVVAIEQALSSRARSGTARRRGRRRPGRERGLCRELAPGQGTPWRPG